MVHSFPLISSLFNIIFTKIVFLRKDAKFAFLINICYIPVNILGKFAFKREVYWQSDLSNWSNPIVTFSIIFASSVLVYLVVFFIAKLTQRIHNF